MRELLNYLAGLFDGEGTLGYYSSGAGKRKRLTLAVKMTDRGSIELLHQTFGGNITECKPYKAGYKPQWRWSVTDRLAHQAYNQMAPFLRIKKL